MSAIGATDTTVESSKCEQLLRRARQSIAGGDSSTMRVLPYHLPLVAERGCGSRVWDSDGKEYIDLNMAYGPLIYGHCPPHIVESVSRQIAQSGSQLGFPTEIGVRVAEKVKTLFPSIELLRFSNSGTEAIASAIRLARSFTGRKKIIRFEGHYHGWSDAVFNRYHAPLSELPEKGYGPAVAGTDGMNGAPHDCLCVRWNDLDTLDRCLEEHGDAIAACIMEPVMGNAGVIPPEPQYLHGVRERMLDRDALLIFDEVITGMRVAAGGAQQYYDVHPDITILSKALGAGYPIAAFGTSREIMEPVVDGTVFHGGVYSGNAVVMAAAEASLDAMLADTESMYQQLHAISDELAGGIREILSRLSVPHVVQHVGPMLSLFLTNVPVDRITEYRQVLKYCNSDRYIEFQHFMQQAGVYFHPNQFEPMFLSTTHTSSDIATVLERIEEGARHCLVM